jgi:hypothetical protein
MAEGHITQSIDTTYATTLNYVFAFHKTMLSRELTKCGNDGVIGIKQRALIRHQCVSFSKVVVVFPIKREKGRPVGTSPKRVLLPSV